jgi:chromosome segregation ATPase
MPSADDLFNQLVAANNRLESIKGELLDVKASTDAVKNAVNQVNSTLNNGFSELITLGQYTNQALWQNSKQNDTIICILEHISKNTCELLNQAVVQTRVQTEMEEDIDALESMYATVNGAAALEWHRLKKLEEQIEKCCPPPKPETPCHYAPCPIPPKLPDPPKGRPNDAPR